jgi:hypothetical protein
MFNLKYFSSARPSDLDALNAFLWGVNPIIIGFAFRSMNSAKAIEVCADGIRYKQGLISRLIENNKIKEIRFDDKSVKIIGIKDVVLKEFSKKHYESLEFLKSFNDGK